MNPSNPEESNVVAVAPTTLTARDYWNPSRSYGPVLFPRPSPPNEFGLRVLVPPPSSPNSFGPVLVRPLSPPNSFGLCVLVSPPSPPNSFGLRMLVPPPALPNSFGPVVVQPLSPPNSCGPVLFPRPTPPYSFGPVLVQPPYTLNRDFRPEIHPDERSLFLTFSKGFPLTESQMFAFFYRLYKSDVENVLVHKPNSGKPSLFGKVTFKRAEIPNLVLNYQEKVCLTVDGFPLVCKKFVSKKTTETEEFSYASNSPHDGGS